MNRMTLLIGALVLAGCSSSREQITQAYHEVVEHCEKGEWEEVYDSFSRKGKRSLDKKIRTMGLTLAAFTEKKLTEQDIRRMPGKRLFKTLCENNPRIREAWTFRGEIRDLEVERNNATLRVQLSGETTTIYMVYEGEWKLAFAPK